MDSGACDLGIVYKQDLATEQAFGRHCNKMYVGQPVAYSPEGVPFSPKHAKALSYLMYRAKNDGTWEILVERAILRSQSVLLSAD